MYKNKILAAGFLLLFICTVGCRSIDDGKGGKPSLGNMGINAGMDGSVGREEATIANVTHGGSSVHVVVAGDNMVQTGVVNSAASHAEEGEYNFGFCYDGAKDIISRGDVKIINQETLICDNEDIEISHSNRNFNSPVEVGSALIDTGFNVFSMANNHLLDKGVGGLESCMTYWEKMKGNYHGLITYGVYKNEADMNNIRVCEISGIKIAFLAYTENVNSYDYLEDSEIQIVLTSEEDKIKSQIEAAHTVADAVIVSVHWGTEDSFEVSESVNQLAQNMIDWGADVILGTHPHVPQTMEYLTRPDGTQGFVFYSLGNFISSQTYNINLIGEIAEFDIETDIENNVSVKNVQVSPVITHFEGTDYEELRVIPYRDYTEELCSAHGLPQVSGIAPYNEWSMEKIKEIIDTGIPAEYQKLD